MSQTSPIFHTVALLSPPFTTLTYRQPVWWPKPHFFTLGMRVAIPLGKSLRVGVLLDTGKSTADVPEGVEVKDMGWPLETTALLTEKYMCMVRELALRQCRTEGNILGYMLPTGLRSTQLKIRHFVGTKPRQYSIKALWALPEQEQAVLAHALLQGQADILLPQVKAAEGELCVLTVEPPWPVRPLAQRQIAILDYLLETGSTSRGRLNHALGKEHVGAALTSLVRHGHVRIDPLDVEEELGRELLPPPPPAFQLSEAQSQAVATFAAALQSGKAHSHLLYGVTGSGKTAVYLELAKLCYAQGKSLLLLAPEVALALKLQRDAALALPHMPVFLYHGYQSTAKREKLFRTLRTRQEACIIVGTRSALFLPLAHIGAIVLDEEHDASFKQDEKLAYQAKEVAWFRVTQHRGLLVLGSATPDMKTFHAVQEGRLPMQTLPARVGGGTLPHIKLVTIAGLAGSASLLAAESEQAIKDTLARGEQIVVLLNRRGYAPLMYCLDCNQVARCPHCEIALTYHKKREKLVCHYCGYSVSFPCVCVHCKGMNYLPMGEGTEKLAEYLTTLVAPLGKVLRLDRDSTRREGRMEEILESFARQEAQILVGTQMLSKGHHFPQVTLALIADGDLGLNLPDYRAAERVFQLLIQSAGRAGRGQKPGTVLIQTRDTSHYCWKYVQNADYEGFYAEEIIRRQRRLYPPFVNLALIRISHSLDWQESSAALQALGTSLRTLGREMGVTVLGPVPAPLALLRGQKRFHCLLKGHDWKALRHIYMQALAQSDTRFLNLFLDIDPINML